MVIVSDIRTVLLCLLLSRFLQSISTAGIMQKGCEIALCCNSIILLYWAVSNAGVMIFKILLKYLIMTLVIQDLVQETRYCGK
jgi:hypothetical protein